MVYRIYPAILFANCIAFMIGGFAVLGACSVPPWSRFSVPVLGPIAGYVATCAIVTRFPRVRYVNDAEVDGLGYVHQPLGVILLCFLIGLGVVVLRIVR